MYIYKILLLFNEFRKVLNVFNLFSIFSTQILTKMLEYVSFEQGNSGFGPGKVKN